MFRSGSVILVAAAVTLAACSKPSNPDNSQAATQGAAAGSGPVNPLIEGTTFGAALQVDLKASTKSASGLYYRDVVVGTGDEATTGKVIAVNYDGALADGTHFEAGPYRFPLGGRQVIPGWDEGLVGMKVGGKRQLIIPPDLAYGPMGSPPKIPANAILVFTVELVGVQ